MHKFFYLYTCECKIFTVGSSAVCSKRCLASVYGSVQKIISFPIIWFWEDWKWNFLDLLLFLNLNALLVPQFKNSTFFEYRQLKQYFDEKRSFLSSPMQIK